MSSESPGDYDFVIKIIQFLENHYGITFFITTKDFDALYNWWEKRIPIGLIKESIAKVVERWDAKNKEIYSFSNFTYEVRKNFKAFLQLNVGIETGEKETAEAGNECEEIENFFNNYPDELAELKADFETIFQQLKNKESFNLDRLYQKMLDLFKEDSELNLKTSVFVRSLSPELRKPEIIQRYRLNYLINKFNIPDFKGIASDAC